MILSAQGWNGQVEFDGQWVTITRHGLRAEAAVGGSEKRIPAQAVQAVQWKEPGALGTGYIQFTIAGGVEKRSKFGRQLRDANRDENTVTFTRKRAPQFAAIRAAVERAIKPQAGGVSSADELGKLAALHGQGVLSDAEFAAAKARVLGL